MDSNTVFMEIVPKSLAILLAINLVFIIIFVIANRKDKKDIEYFSRLGITLIGDNIIAFLVILCIVFFLPKKTEEQTIILEPEVIIKENIIEKENIIDVPSIILPLNPEGEQAIIIDSTSNKMEEFMNDFYDENVYFFNSRQNEIFILKEEGLQNYSGLDFEKIEYEQSNSTLTLQLDDVGYNTIWLFSDLSQINIESSKCNVILYVPKQLTEEETRALKEVNSNITIITIEQIK